MNQIFYTTLHLKILMILNHFLISVQKKAAGQRSLHPDIDNTKEKHVYSVRLKLGNVAHIGYNSGTHAPLDIIHGLMTHKHITPEEHELVRKNYLKPATDESYEHLSKFINSKGIDTVSYKNSEEDPGSISYINTRPNQVRILKKGNYVNNRKYQV